MVFVVKLPAAPRTLPPAFTLPRSVTVKQKGISVTVDAARLGTFKQGPRPVGQRDLTFHLKIVGGEIANDNVASDLDFATPVASKSGQFRSRIGIGGSGAVMTPLPPLGTRLAGQRLVRKIVVGPSQPFSILNGVSQSPMTLTDPYGLPLLVPGQSITPLISKETLQGARRGEGMIWVAPVNNAGKGTDVMRIHLDVAPSPKKGRITSGMPIPFDLLVPIQTGDEI